MVFSEAIFLFVYLPVVLAVYYLAPLRFRNGVLFLFNLIFYGWGEPVYLLLMLFTILVNYVGGLAIGRAQRQEKSGKSALIITIAINLGLLMFFKYWNLIGQMLPVLPQVAVPLPVGISFYTFQALSYAIDVYRRDAAPQRSYVKFSTYVTLFPQLIAGPIVRYKDIDNQLEQRQHSTTMFAAGVQTFVVGLCKKVLLANNLGPLWEFYRDLPAGELTALGAWLGIIAFALQIYFDFSGYSDMAIGLGRMLGFEFLPNFNYPYLSTSITEFWRRWHMSLGTWFRDYLYIPLGGNRVSRGRFCLNIMIVWALTGMWHGAAWNFLLWGVFYGALLLLEKLVLGKWLAKAPAGVGHVYAMLLVLLGWVLFAVEDLSAVGGYFAAMFGFGAAGGFAPHDAFQAGSYAVVLVIGILACLPFAKRGLESLPQRPRQVATLVLLAAGLLLSTAYVVDASYNPFLYFRF